MRARLLSPDEQHELVRVMSGRFDVEPGAAADGGAEGDEQLGEDRDGVGLCVRRDPVTISPSSS